ncbi:GerAB/ArcD/ProY family transporter [Clostridium massiliodielmoense]|uniref:GerAB/ArcD/ProY family transporter n=1 Tax=Clostridium massiliodielmoense TaxID=1776385 RepID=UPI0001668BEE|nr:endospore germination permease [Clostridium massiliodielmoense]EDS78179.1 spore germination protein [Clostridium botulinum C str. Eklund]KEH97656.1 spore gernimation protein [Clostridium botulinum C/D str. BKT12695]NEZ49821.1 spore gernimation protein [Clostridium botulinum]
MKKNNIISKYDLFVTMVATIAGTSIFAYPRILGEKVGTDGWIVIVLTGLVIVPILYIMKKSIEVSEYRKFTDMIQYNFGKILGGIIALVVILTAILVLSMEMRVFTEVLKMYLLKRTPSEFIIILVILVGAFLVRGEIESVIRFNEIVFWLMFLPILIAILFVLKGSDYTNIFPVLTHKPIDYLVGIKSSVFAFLGFEIIYMLYPLVKKKREVMKVTYRGLIFVVVFYCIVSITTVIVFSKSYISQLLWPTITMLSTVNLPGTFVERWEGAIMAFWFIFFFTTYVNLYYFSSEVVKDVFHLEDIKISVIVVTPIIYLLSLYPQNIAEVYKIKEKFSPYIGLGVMVILPILLLIIGTIKSRRVKNEV